MPRNTGSIPRVPLVDIQFANGTVKRGQDPKQWNWKPIGSPFDIKHWQEVKG